MFPWGMMPLRWSGIYHRSANPDKCLCLKLAALMPVVCAWGFPAIDCNIFCGSAEGSYWPELWAVGHRGLFFGEFV